MSIGELIKRLEHFDKDKTVFLSDSSGESDECYAALRMEGGHPDSVMLMTLDRLEDLQEKSGY